MGVALVTAIHLNRDKNDSATRWLLLRIQIELLGKLSAVEKQIQVEIWRIAGIIQPMVGRLDNNLDRPKK